MFLTTPISDSLLLKWCQLIIVLYLFGAAYDDSGITLFAEGDWLSWLLTYMFALQHIYFRTILITSYNLLLGMLDTAYLWHIRSSRLHLNIPCKRWRQWYICIVIYNSLFVFTIGFITFFKPHILLHLLPNNTLFTLSEVILCTL